MTGRRVWIPRNRARGGARPHDTRGLHVVALLAPAVVLLVVIYLLPIFLNVMLSFTNWSTSRLTDFEFVGLRNVTDLLSGGTAAQAIPTTIVFAIAVTVIQNILGLALALAVESGSRSAVFFRTANLIPVLISALAAGFVWRAVLDPKGPLNQVLSSLTGQGVSIAWLGSLTTTVFVVAMIQAWKFYGLTMLIYLAGLKSIPRDLVESAQIDGAGRWQVFRHVKFPLLGPSITVNVVLTMVGGLAAYDVVVATTGGGPARATETVYIVVQQYLASGRLAFSTTITLAMYAIVLLVAIPLVAYLRRREVAL